jgi:hypothetical protein
MQPHTDAPNPTTTNRTNLYFGIMLSGAMSMFFAGFFSLLASQPSGSQRGQRGSPLAGPSDTVW